MILSLDKQRVLVSLLRIDQMSMLEISIYLDVLRVIVSLSFLLASSWYDYKFREVSNRMWILFAPIGFVLTFVQYTFELAAGKASSIFIFWIVSVAITAAISLSLFYAGFFGGADAKALICLSIAIPIYPEFSLSRFTVVIPLFPLATLVNAVFASSLLVLAIMCRNIVRYVQLKGEIFKGLEHEPFWKKALVFVSGIKVNPEKLRDNFHYIPLESLVIGEGGEVTRHLKVSPQLEEKNSMALESLDGEVWVTPGLPFLIFVTIGFIAAFFFGDFTTWLANLMLNL